MKITKLFPTIFFVFVFINSNAQTKNNSLLWEISGNGLKQSSYLYGTIHMIDKKDFFVRKEIDSVFNLSEQVAFEIKLDDIASLMKIQSWMNLPEGKTIKDFCSPEEYEKIKKYFADSLQTDITIFDNQKPFGLYQAQISDYGKGEQQSFEIYFLTKCINSQKPIFGLENVEDELKIFDEIPYNEQMDWVIQGIDSAASYNQLLTELTDAYKNENLNSLNKLINECSPELMKYKDEFITNRNESWIPVIENLIKNKSTFIAVGAGHLGNDDGLIELLRTKGYLVKPI